jgi:hypothetical protein
MAGERAAIFGRLIEELSESDVDADSRQEMYDILLEVLEEFDVKGIDGYLDIDPSFDEAYNEKYPPEIEEYEE